MPILPILPILNGIDTSLEEAKAKILKNLEGYTQEGSARGLRLAAQAQNNYRPDHCSPSVVLWAELHPNTEMHSTTNSYKHTEKDNRCSEWAILLARCAKIRRPES